jgi:hypothetical protein
MLRNTMLSVLAAGLVLFAGSASATERTFKFTGKVVDTVDGAFAPIGSPVTGTFKYDDALSPTVTVSDWYAAYELQTFLSATINGHTVISDRMNVAVHDSYSDIVDINGVGGIMIDDAFHPDGYFGFRLLGGADALQSRALPGAYDLGRFMFERNGYVFIDSSSGVQLQFSIDSIVDATPVPPTPTPTCNKKNGKPFKHCPPPRR